MYVIWCMIIFIKFLSNFSFEFSSSVIFFGRSLINLFRCWTYLNFCDICLWPRFLENHSLKMTCPLNCRDLSRATVWELPPSGSIKVLTKGNILHLFPGVSIPHEHCKCNADVYILKMLCHRFYMWPVSALCTSQ